MTYCFFFASNEYFGYCPTLTASLIVLFNRGERASQGFGEGIGNSSLLKPNVGGLYSTSDVHSLWSFE